MIDTSPSANQIASAAPTGSTAPPDDGGGPMIDSDFETFLTMLTTQMRNQDPLNPMKSQDFAVQLATFSGVEQQVRTNQLIEGLSTRMGLADLAGWIGMEARAAVPAQFDGDPVQVVPATAPEAEAADLVIRNAAGREVDRRPLSMTQESVTWQGVTAEGRPLPEGRYSFEVESRRGDEIIDTRPAEIYARVAEVRADGGRAMLVLEGGGEIASDAVSAVRRAD
ncbi:flagellar basal body rod modification protein [Rhodobacteraceae bacterium WD3A24]|nr:flagellar basal body rod modification protein [Rhodobacteraceae bacterium WD3A24]